MKSTMMVGAMRGDLDGDDIQEQVVHAAQEETIELGERKDEYSLLLRKPNYVGYKAEDDASLQDRGKGYKKYIDIRRSYS
ncbi:hypothetical protein BDA96_05G216400 [Sorghum bicolor]|uniref:Uncharacterized protein n=2 Tax=Sorghum bicolor TaxID=4558 RepID=A0A921R1M7_SORBI|nr:hypothetical protein BDA96_05G216400 [Sorghum bicolor]KXG29020.1 hypothetical protein SORBI_3005G200100 [Sorghum bicolor]